MVSRAFWPSSEYSQNLRFCRRPLVLLRIWIQRGIRPRIVVVPLGLDDVKHVFRLPTSSFVKLDGFHYVA